MLSMHAYDWCLLCNAAKIKIVAIFNNRTQTSHNSRGLVLRLKQWKMYRSFVLSDFLFLHMKAYSSSCAKLLSTQGNRLHTRYTWFGIWLGITVMFSKLQLSAGRKETDTTESFQKFPQVWGNLFDSCLIVISYGLAWCFNVFDICEN